MNINQSKKLFKATKRDNQDLVPVEDCIIVEEALQVNINGKAFTITMRTPGSDEFLVRGLMYTEGIYIGNKALDIRIKEKNEEGVIRSVNVLLPPQQIGQNYYESRSLLSVSSCGICGKKELKDLILEGNKLKMEKPVAADIFPGLFSVMKTRQPIFLKTGGCHAAACFDLAGNVLSIQEDIGRHNAVDKVIGELLDKNILEKAMFLLVSGRISFEIVSKTFKARIPFLAAVSSPSSLSIEIAVEMGITLLAFCRGENITCYSHPGRLTTRNIDVLID